MSLNHKSSKFGDFAQVFGPQFSICYLYLVLVRIIQNKK